MGKQHLKNFSTAFIAGIGWSLGASLGFALLITLLTYVLNLLGGLPLVGRFFGQITEHVLKYLQTAN